MSRPRPADWLAGAAGVFLLVTLFLPWYTVHLTTPARGREGFTLFIAGIRPNPTAWQAFSVIDVLLALLALLAIAVPVVAATARGPAKPVAVAVLSSVGSSLAVLLVAYRLLNQPGRNDLVTVRYGG